MINNKTIDELFAVGAHYGFVKSRRHPSAKPFIFGQKGGIEIFNLEKTSLELGRALDFVEEKGRENALMLIVGGKAPAREAVKKTGEELSMPFVSGRWIGGTLTNFSEIKKRLARLEELSTMREKGELTKYTKKERLLIDREIEKLQRYFGGITGLKSMPKLLFIIDPKKEHIALSEARKMNIPVVALSGSDNNLQEITCAIPANDSSKQTIEFILKKVVEAYNKGKRSNDNSATN